MKKVLKLAALFAAAALAFALSSCSKDEMNEKRIVGKWQTVSVSGKEYEGEKLVGDYSSNFTTSYMVYIFNSGGTGNVMYVEDNNSEVASIKWVILGDKLTVSFDNDTELWEIIYLKGNSMILSMTDEYVYNGVKCRDILTATFKKI